MHNISYILMLTLKYCILMFSLLFIQFNSIPYPAGTPLAHESGFNKINDVELLVSVTRTSRVAGVRFEPPLNEAVLPLKSSEDEEIFFFG